MPPLSARSSRPARPLRLAFIPAALAGALVVHAQEAPPAGQAQVHVQGKADAYDPRRDDTAMKFVIRREDIARYGDTSLLDVLKRIPGVTVSGSAGRNGEIRMQGLGSGYTQVLIDGQAPPAGMAVETLAPDTIERIEVLRAASAELPTQSIAGTINIVLRKVGRNAVARNDARKPERDLKLGYGIGRDTRSPNASLRLAERANGFAYELAGSLVHDDFRGEVPSIEQAYDAAGRQTLLRTTAGHEDGGMTTLNLAPRLEWDLGQGDSLGWESFVNLNRFRVLANTPTTTLLGDAPPYPDKRIDMRNRNDALRSELHWMHGLASGARLDARLGASASRTDNTSERDAGGNPVVGPLQRSIDSRGRDAGLVSTGKLTVPLVAGHALAAGWDGAWDRRTDTRREVDTLHPGLPVPDGDDAYAGHVARIAAYAQDEWNLTPRWSAYLGGRWEGVRIDLDGTGFGTSRSTSSVFSPVLQTLYKLVDEKDRHDGLRLALARTYRAPGLDQLIPHRTTSINNSQVEPDTEGTPYLKPELALGLDAAWEHSWAEGALLSLSASTRHIDDVARTLVQFDGSRWVALPVNYGRARSSSLQLETSFPLPTVFAAAPPIELRANVARNWSRLDAVPGPDNRLERQTPLSANLGLDWHGGRVDAGASFGFQSGGPVRVSVNQIAYQNVKRDLELYALFKLAPGYQLRITGANLLGQDMVNEASYLNPDGTLLRNRLVNVGHASLKMMLESRF
jgi:outer membrane receptor for ferrienterochelin and colicins